VSSCRVSGHLLVVQNTLSWIADCRRCMYLAISILDLKCMGGAVYPGSSQGLQLQLTALLLVRDELNAWPWRRKE
jgi:hypothetical protein